MSSNPLTSLIEAILHDRMEPIWLAIWMVLATAGRDGMSVRVLREGTELTDSRARRSLDRMTNAGLVERVSLPASGPGRPSSGYRVVVPAEDADGVFLMGEEKSSQVRGVFLMGEENSGGVFPTGEENSPGVDGAEGARVPAYTRVRALWGSSITTPSSFTSPNVTPEGEEVVTQPCDDVIVTETDDGVVEISARPVSLSSMTEDELKATHRRVKGEFPEAIARRMLRHFDYNVGPSWKEAWRTACDIAESEPDRDYVNPEHDLETYLVNVIDRSERGLDARLSAGYWLEGYRRRRAETIERLEGVRAGVSGRFESAQEREDRLSRGAPPDRGEEVLRMLEQGR